MESRIEAAKVMLYIGALEAEKHPELWSQYTFIPERAEPAIEAKAQQIATEVLRFVESRLAIPTGAIDLNGDGTPAVDMVGLAKSVCGMKG